MEKAHRGSADGTASDSEELLAPLTRSSWWPLCTDDFRSALATGDRRVAVFYGADIDGFVAGYFAAYFATELARPDTSVQWRAVWNFEYDFTWVEHFITDYKIDFLICVDVPIAQEEGVLGSIGHCQVLIYDHHVLPRGQAGALRNVTYINSRLYEDSVDSHPASVVMAGLVSALVGDLSCSEQLLTASGAQGDRALSRYPQLTRSLHRQYPMFFDRGGLPSAEFTRVGAGIDALLRVGAGSTAPDAIGHLHQLFSKMEFTDAIDEFFVEYRVNEACSQVALEAAAALSYLAVGTKGRVPVLCAIPEMLTFSVGDVASSLADRETADIVAIGYRAASAHIQFELRTPASSNIDLVRVLDLQRQEFIPITAGGHPQAAGALVMSEQAEMFCDSLRTAYARYRDEPSPRGAAHAAGRHSSKPA